MDISLGEIFKARYIKNVPDIPEKQKRYILQLLSPAFEEKFPKAYPSVKILEMLNQADMVIIVITPMDYEPLSSASFFPMDHLEAFPLEKCVSPFFRRIKLRKMVKTHFSGKGLANIIKHLINQSSKLKNLFNDWEDHGIHYTIDYNSASATGWVAIIINR